MNNQEESTFDQAVELLQAVRDYGQGYDEEGNFAEFTEEGYAEVADPFDEALVGLGYVLEDIEEGPTFSAHLMIGYSGNRGSTSDLLKEVLKNNKEKVSPGQVLMSVLDKNKAHYKA